MQLISATNLLYMVIPVAVVGYFYYRWVGDKKEVLYASFRMVGQLLLIGYILSYIFEEKTSYLTFFIVLVMISMSSLIAIRNVKKKNFEIYTNLFIAILIGGSINLFLVIFFVLDLDSFNSPRYVIPIAGMLYANCMNAVSLVAERFEKELQYSDYIQARAAAFKASMIPQINSFLAVGLVSLPGMMTGQVLAGTDPIIAVRYQIMVMLMVLGSAGISTIIYLLQQKK